MCSHLQQTLNYLSIIHGIKIVKIVNGKGWGAGYLVSGNIPFLEIIKEKQIDICVTMSLVDGLISCEVCWENIAEYSCYKDKWG